MPQVSVLIANFNGEKFLQNCVDSVLRQEGDIEIEIIIHDDASTDASLELMHSLYPKDKFSNIYVLKSHKNVGFCISNNRMAKEAKGQYILLLNNDAELASDALVTLLSAAQLQAPQGILSLPQLDWETGKVVDKGCLLDPFCNTTPNLDDHVSEVGMVIGACLWLPRTLWNNLGGFPEWFGSISEDLYLSCRARLQGFPVQVTQTSYYRHHQGASFGGNRVKANQLRSTFRRRALSERNKTFVMAITYPSPLMQIMLPLHLLLLLLEGLLLSLLKLDSRYLREIYLPVFGALIKYRKEWWALRRIVQKNRQVTRAEFYAMFDWMPYKFRMLARHGLPHLR
ncbi:glycosyltransferase family 2 protein [Thiorhodovibrio winogradskyi]|nr:glycosyltransferase [Thiorhodovibrio winogradskyi]